MVRCQMQGPCLFPMTMEKQTALQSVLEDLLINTGFARVLHVEQVLPLPSVPAGFSMPATFLL